MGEQLVSSGYKFRFGCLGYVLFRALQWIFFHPCLVRFHEKPECVCDICNFILTWGESDPKYTICTISHNLARSRNLVHNTTAAGLDMGPPGLTLKGVHCRGGSAFLFSPGKRPGSPSPTSCRVMLWSETNCMTPFELILTSFKVGLLERSSTRWKDGEHLQESL